MTNDDLIDEEIRECEVCGQQVEPDWVEKHEHYSQWTGPMVGKFIEVKGFGGVAFRVRHHSEQSDEVVAVMVGDDRKWTFEVDICTVIDREVFCGECGQIGCTHDGLDRSES